MRKNRRAVRKRLIKLTTKEKKTITLDSRRHNAEEKEEGKRREMMVVLRDRTVSSMPPLHTKTASTTASSSARVKLSCCSSRLFKSLLVYGFFLLGFVLFLSGQWRLLSVQTANHLQMEKQEQEQQQQQRRHFFHDHFRLQLQLPSRLAAQEQKEQQQQQQRLERNSDKVNDSSEPSTTRQLLESRDSPTRTPLAWKIVSSAFQETYVHLKQCCDDKRTAIQRDYSSSSSSSSSSTTTQQEQQHKEQQVLVECLAETRTTSGSSWPWWFQTLLRDASPYSTLHAPFHQLWMRLPPPSQTNNNGNDNRVNQHDSNAFVPPPLSPTTPTSSLLQFCAIEKISSTTWGSVQCKLNYNVKSNKVAKAAMRAATATANVLTMGDSDGGGREPFFWDSTNKDRVTVGGGHECTLQLTAEEKDYYLAATGSTNNNDNEKNTTSHSHHSHDNNGHYRHNHKRIHRAVFLRDPLERFLSGFLNKCVWVVREKHCEPNQLFGVSAATVRQAEHAASGRGDQRAQRRYDRTHQNRTLTTDLIPPLHKGGRIVGRSTSPLLTTTTNTSTSSSSSSSSGMKTPPVLNASHYHFLLDAYVELFPLSWNVHFYPQSLYCNGLFLDLLKEYDFIGTFFRDAAKKTRRDGRRTTYGWMDGRVLLSTVLLYRVYLHK